MDRIIIVIAMAIRQWDVLVQAITGRPNGKV